MNPSTVNRYSLGQAYIELGRFSDAETQYSEIQRLAPQEAGGYLGMGLTYSRQGKHEEAIRQFKQAISRDSDLYDAYAQMGYSYADMGDMESAQNMVDILERLDQADLADTLSRYMYKVDPPKMMFAQLLQHISLLLGQRDSPGGSEQLPDEPKRIQNPLHQNSVRQSKWTGIRSKTR